MSNSIVKNAVVLLGVQQGKVDFDLTPVLKALREQHALLEKLAQQQVVVETRAKAAAASEVSGINKRVAALGKYDDHIEEMFERHREMEKRHEQEVKAEERLSAARVNALKGVLQGATQAGGGVLHLARAFAVMGIDSEDGLGKILKSLQPVLVAFDAFKGVTSIVLGVVRVVESLAAVEKAETAVVILHTTATTADTAAVAGNTAARVTSMAATNADTAAVAGNTVAVTSNTAARAAALALANPLIAAGLAVGAVVTALILLNREEKQTIEEKVDALREERDARQEAIDQHETRARLSGQVASAARVNAAKQAVDATNAQIKAVRELVKEEEENARNPFQRGRGKALERAGNLLDEIRDLTAKRAEEQLRLNEAEEAHLNVIKRQAEAKQRLADQERKAALDRQRELQQYQSRYLRFQDSQIQKARQHSEQIKGATRSNRIAFASLNALEKERVRAEVANLASGGELSKDGNDLFRRAGPALARLADDQLADQGKGIDSLLGSLGITPDGRGGEDAVNDIVQTGAKVSKVAEQTFDQLATTFTRTLEAMGDVVKRVDEIEDQAAKGAG